MSHQYAAAIITYFLSFTECVSTRNAIDPLCRKGLFLDPHSVVHPLSKHLIWNLTVAVLTSFDYVFAENGLVAYKAGEIVEIQSFKALLGEEKLKSLINFILHYIAGVLSHNRLPSILWWGIRP